MNKKNTIKILDKKNYLALLSLGDGLKIFRHLYVELNGRKKDLLNNGNLSCAVFVSSILKIFSDDSRGIKLIKYIHATVENTIKDMHDSGWHEVKKMKPGAVIYWGLNPETGHTHLGFYLGGGKAISNNYRTKSVIIHPISSHGHTVEKIFWHDFLN